MSGKFIDIPFIEAEYKFDDWIKYLIFMHILPYMLRPASEDDWKGFALPISLYIQTLLLKNMKNSNHRLKTQIEALEGSKYKKLNFCTSHYRREFDFYQSIGGNGALLEAFTLREIKEFIQNKAEYFMAIHAIVKYYMNWVDEYKKDKSTEPSFNECFLKLKNRLSDYPYQTLAEKALEEGAWKEFKYSAHLIYGYIETLLEKGQIPQIPEGNVVNFIKSNVANVLTKFDDNYLFLKRMLIHSFKAQDVLLKHKHSKSSRNLELWILPEHLKKQYKLGMK